MQNTNPADSKLPKLPPPESLPELVPTSTVVMLAIFFGFAVWCLFQENWLGAAIDGIAFTAIFIIGYLRYRKVRDLHKHYRLLKVMEVIVNTPTMREEGNSIIFTFIFPSPEIMEELNKLHTQQKAKE